MVAPALFSSATDDWATPQDFFDKLDAEFHFTLDACASPGNAKCKNYFTKEDDCLRRSWSDRTVFMNPVYGNSEKSCRENCKKKKCAQRGFHNLVYRPGIRDFMFKADMATRFGATVVCLVPARTDSNWWWMYVEPRRLGQLPGEVRFVRGRLKFGGAKNSAPFPSAVVVMLPVTAPVVANEEP